MSIFSRNIIKYTNCTLNICHKASPEPLSKTVIDIINFSSTFFLKNAFLVGILYQNGRGPGCLLTQSSSNFLLQQTANDKIFNIDSREADY
jgi:hypothetical protein